MSSEAAYSATLETEQSLKRVELFANSLGRRFSAAGSFLLHDLESGLDDSEEIPSYFRELVGQPSQNRNRSEGSDSYVEVDS